MLRDEIVSEVQAMVEDPDYWTASRITTFANQGMRKMAYKHGISVPGYYLVTAVVGQQSYMLPLDWVAFHRIYYSDDYNEIAFQGMKPESVYSNYTDPLTEGDPEIAFIWAREDREELWVYPTFGDADTMYWFYWRRPPAIVNDNDEPLIPRDWHTYLVDYVHYFTLFKDRELSLSEFESWWELTMSSIQVADSIQEAAERQIKIGDSDAQFPDNVVEIAYAFRDSASDAAVK